MRLKCQTRQPPLQWPLSGSSFLSVVSRFSERQVSVLTCGNWNGTSTALGGDTQVTGALQIGRVI